MIKLFASVLVTLGALNLVSQVRAADIEITDNGAKSDSTVIVHTAETNLVSQLNESVVLTEIRNTANTGGNSIIGQTGGESAVGTGGATSSVDVLITGATNEAAAADECGCIVLPDVKISDNGYKSDSFVKFSNWTFSGVQQANLTTVATGIKSSVKTGANSIKWGTGSGAGILTGEGLSITSVLVQAPSNVLH